MLRDWSDREPDPPATWRARLLAAVLLAATLAAIVGPGVILRR